MTRSFLSPPVMLPKKGTEKIEDREEKIRQFRKVKYFLLTSFSLLIISLRFTCCPSAPKESGQGDEEVDSNPQGTFNWEEKACEGKSERLRGRKQ